MNTIIIEVRTWYEECTLNRRDDVVRRGGMFDQALRNMGFAVTSRSLSTSYIWKDGVPHFFATHYFSCEYDNSNKYYDCVSYEFLNNWVKVNDRDSIRVVHQDIVTSVDDASPCLEWDTIYDCYTACTAAGVLFFIVSFAYEVNACINQDLHEAIVTLNKIRKDDKDLKTKEN